MIRIDSHFIMKSSLIIAVFTAYIVITWSVGVFSYSFNEKDLRVDLSDPNNPRIHVQPPETNEPGNDFYHIDRIPLNKPTTFFFKKGFNIANHDRYPLRKQMTCEGPFCNEITLPDIIRCETPGNGQVKCYGKFPNGYDLDTTDLECEPFWNDDDPCILRDSCSVSFTLKKYIQPKTETYQSPKPANFDFWLFCFLVLFILFLFVYCATTHGINNNVASSATYIHQNTVQPEPNRYYFSTQQTFPYNHYAGTYHVPSNRPVSEQLDEARSKILSQSETHLSTGTGTIKKPSPKIDSTMPSSDPAPEEKQKPMHSLLQSFVTPKPENEKETHLSTGSGTINPKPKPGTHLSTGTGGFRKRNAEPKRVPSN